MTKQSEVRIQELGNAGAAFVSKVLVSLGQTVSRDTKLLLIETEKVDVDVFAPAAGRVTQILVGLNTTVHDGDLVVVLEPTESEQLEPAPNKPSVVAQPDANPERSTGSDFHASPWIRGLSRERGIDLSQVAGSGRNGRIVYEDLLPIPVALDSAPAHTSEARARNDAPVSPLLSTESRPLTRLQRAVARNLSQNWAQIPHVTQFDETDITELEAFRVALNDDRQKQGPKLSLLPFVVKATACALAAFPEFNGSLVGEDLILNRNVHVGFAVDTPDGLQVPVVQHTDQLNLLPIAREVLRLAERARDSKLVPKDLQGGTFTISNLGGAGGTAFTPIIIAPQVAILGISKAELKPKWNGSAFVPRLMLPLSLSYDHRVINGVAGARFISYLSTVLSDLRRALL